MQWTKLLSHKRLGSNQRNEGSRSGNHSRTEFEIDFDRVIFSYPFRRLQDKTQVIPLPEHDFVHTRLTHSLEVSSVGRSLGRNAGSFILQKYPELREAGYSEFDFGSIVAAASLIHDIGNPPFGHSGEKALSEYCQHLPSEEFTPAELADLRNFEGNAQGFRILCDQKYQDLKLTYATVGAFMKYPCESLAAGDKTRKSRKKFGFYQSEKKMFQEVAAELGLKKNSSDEALAWCRHPLVYLVEAADDICYLLIDLEDAARMKIVSLEKYIELVAPIIGEQLNYNKLYAITDSNQQIGVLRAMAINRLIEECGAVFRENEASILRGEFDTALCDLIPSAPATQAIAEFSYQYIYQAPRVLEIQAAGFEVLPRLIEMISTAVDDFVKNGKKSNPANLNLIQLLSYHHFQLSEDDQSAYLRTRKILDFVSGMTDSFAVNFYRKIKGISI